MILKSVKGVHRIGTGGGMRYASDADPPIRRAIARHWSRDNGRRCSGGRWICSDVTRNDHPARLASGGSFDRRRRCCNITSRRHQGCPPGIFAGRSHQLAKRRAPWHGAHQQPIGQPRRDQAGIPGDAREDQRDHHADRHRDDGSPVDAPVRALGIIELCPDQASAGAGRSNPPPGSRRSARGKRNRSG